MGLEAERTTQFEIDAWLRDGGLVVAASDRAARAVASAFHRARRAEGLTAWPAPGILDWKTFVREAWEERRQDGRLLLNPLQEQALWAEIAATHNPQAALLEGPRHRLASLAMEAHELLCSYAPHFLRRPARAAWQRDAAAFSDWLAAFDQACHSNDLISSARLPLELVPRLENDQPPRRPLLLTGFDRILPTQRSVLDAWGAWRQASLSQPASQLWFHEVVDMQTELNACALWCARQLDAIPGARLLVITQNATDRTARGQMERAFLRHTGPIFEFSLGSPLSQIPLPKAAYLLLSWLMSPLAEHELDWLFSTGHAAADSNESSALQAHMRGIRRRNKEQPSWTLKAFTASLPTSPLPVGWVMRMSEAQSRVTEFARRLQTPLDCAELAPQLLRTAGFPGSHALSTAEFQAANRWQQAVESCGSLGFDGRRIPWKDFLSALGRTLDEMLFAPESSDAPIQIAGATESAGLTADAVWFLGTTEDSWPAGGATHPLLPAEVQRQAGMPHATPQLDWDLAQAVTTRLVASTSEVHFSYAIQREDVETRPSRLVSQLAGPPLPLPPELILPANPGPLTVAFQDLSQIAFPPGKVPGGAAVLTAQSQCPFKAFATARLAAQSWRPAEPALSASQRGSLLHAVLHSIWVGPPNGIRSHKDLRDLAERSSFVQSHVRSALKHELSNDLRNRLPRRYLELEEQRLANVVCEWLDYEATRVEFAVAGTEVDRTIHLGGLTFDLRLDRLDRLNDDSLLVIDYKSGDVHPKLWDLPRPDDVQLPLYAGFALNEEDEVLGGLVFAKVRAGQREFTGRVGNANGTLLANLTGNHGLLKKAFSAELLKGWRAHIERLAEDFLSGRADVDPRDYPKTCERCGLQTLCRIQENRALLDAGDPAAYDPEAEGVEDE